MPTVAGVVQAFPSGREPLDTKLDKSLLTDNISLTTESVGEEDLVQRNPKAHKKPLVLNLSGEKEIEHIEYTSESGDESRPLRFSINKFNFSFQLPSPCLSFANISTSRILALPLLLNWRFLYAFIDVAMMYSSIWGNPHDMFLVPAIPFLLLAFILIRYIAATIMAFETTSQIDEPKYRYSYVQFLVL